MRYSRLGGNYTYKELICLIYSKQVHNELPDALTFQFEQQGPKNLTEYEYMNSIVTNNAFLTHDDM